MHFSDTDLVSTPFRRLQSYRIMAPLVGSICSNYTLYLGTVALDPQLCMLSQEFSGSVLGKQQEFDYKLCSILDHVSTLTEQDGGTIGFSI